MMKSMTTKERLEKTHDAERQASSMTLVSEPAASAVPLSQASGTWAMQLPGLVPLQPRPTLLAVEPVAQDITLAFGTSHCVTRMLRIVDPLGASSTAPVALGSVGDRDILRLGSIRLDLLLFHLGDPIVLGVEFVTFSPQPAEVARAMLAAMRAGPAIGGGVDCRHAGQPVCLIVVPAALKWFRQIRATFPHLIRHAIDLDEALGDGAAWGMLIVERASAL
ncbi:hypothetical protein DFJ74DRAFT_656987 [Hyaloraphidium curvatum]|nr:hypothetical protein DFJ74DRAFT_656987 [Hyaloraphidium curvatum]